MLCTKGLQSLDVPLHACRRDGRLIDGVGCHKQFFDRNSKAGDSITATLAVEKSSIGKTETQFPKPSPQLLVMRAKAVAPKHDGHTSHEQGRENAWISDIVIQHDYVETRSDCT